MKKLLIRAFLMLAGFGLMVPEGGTSDNNTGGQAGNQQGQAGNQQGQAGNQQGQAGNQQGNANPPAEQGDLAVLRAQLETMQKDMQSYKSQVGHWKAEAEKLKNNGLTQEQKLELKEKELLEKDRQLKTTAYTLALTDSIAAEKIPSYFKDFIPVVTSEKDFDLPETDKVNSIKSTVKNFKAALDKYKAEIIAELKAGNNPAIPTGGNAGAALPPHIQKIIDENAARAAAPTLGVDPFATK